MSTVCLFCTFFGHLFLSLSFPSHSPYFRQYRNAPRFLTKRHCLFSVRDVSVPLLLNVARHCVSGAVIGQPQRAVAPVSHSLVEKGSYKSRHRGREVHSRGETAERAGWGSAKRPQPPRHLFTNNGRLFPQRWNRPSTSASLYLD